MAIKARIIAIIFYVATAILTFSASLALTGLASDIIYTTTETCQIHKEFLKRGRVPILVGLRIYPLDYFESQKASFPNSNRFFYIGCVGRAGKKEVLYCKEGRRAEARWRKKYPEWKMP
jgi:hypothetical protein